MFGTAFGTTMTLIVVVYVGYYGYNIVRDLFFDKSGEIVAEAAVEEEAVDIVDELKEFAGQNTSMMGGVEAEPFAGDKSEGGYIDDNIEDLVSTASSSETEDEEFSQVIGIMKELEQQNETVMNGFIEADSYEELNDDDFDHVSFLFRRAAQSAA